jgi:predicted nucleotidyltransferase
LDDDYVSNLITFLLADEANNFKRWKEEFRALYKGYRIVMMYGSAIKNYAQARDIDIMVVIKKEDFKEVRALINERQKILPKRVHPIELTEQDLINNIKNKKEAIIDVVKNAIILHGQDKYVEIIKNVTSL